MVVLPLSAYHFKFFNQPVTAILTGVLIHLFCVGLPIALVVRGLAKKNGEASLTKKIMTEK
jgi:hypothetical protein